MKMRAFTSKQIDNIFSSLIEIERILEGTQKGGPKRKAILPEIRRIREVLLAGEEVVIEMRT